MLIKRLIIIGFLFLCSGCSWFADNRIHVKPKDIDITLPKYKKILHNIINNRYKNESMLRDIESELAYQKYLQENKNSKL